MSSDVRESGENPELYLQLLSPFTGNLYNATG